LPLVVNSNSLWFIPVILTILLIIFVFYIGSKKTSWETVYEESKPFTNNSVDYEFELTTRGKYQIIIVTYTHSKEIYYYELHSKLSYPSGKTVNTEKSFSPQIESDNKPHLIADSRILFKVKGQKGMFNLSIKLKEMRKNAKISSVKLIIKKY
jgi:hypothetical protein